MSSRALRRAQQQLEQQQISEKLAQKELQAQQESDQEAVSPPKARPSLFAMLGDVGNSEDDEEPAVNMDAPPPPPPPPPSLKPNKPKKKRPKKKTKAAAAETTAKGSSDLDEIDQALLALNLAASRRTAITQRGQQSPAIGISEEVQQLCTMLRVDSQHLYPANEMKRLFGRAALQGIDEEAHGRGAAAAVAGRDAPDTRGLASLSLRRNIFVHGKAWWPRAPSGALAMQLVQKRPDGTVEYTFTHSPTYQEAQEHFRVCVRRGDPERMMRFLNMHPHHISALIKVAEIAVETHDNAAASDLLERALFIFGRSVHSTFPSNLAAGKARLDFRRPENREFWLAVWRYIHTLTERATWRTALEWVKLVLAMAPEHDPYCLRLVFDHLALRSREAQAMVDLVETDRLQRLWKVPPNLAFGVALAHDQLKQPSKARSALKHAIKEYPWFAAWLCKELDISPIPKPVWGKTPNNNYQELLCQLYVPRAKDLWNTTEATSLLVEVCWTLEEELGAGQDPYWLAEIPALDLARHVMLRNDPSLEKYLDAELVANFTSIWTVSDPFPPEDSIKSYGPAGLHQHPLPASRAQLLARFTELRCYFQRLDTDGLAGEEPTLTNLLDALEAAGSNLEEYQRNRDEMDAMCAQLQNQGMDVLFDEHGQLGVSGLEVERDESDDE